MHQVDVAKDAAGKEVTIFEQNEAPAVWIEVRDLQSGFATAAFNPENRGDIPSVPPVGVVRRRRRGAARADRAGPLTLGDTQRSVSRDIEMCHATLPDGTWQCRQFSEMPTGRLRDPVPEVADRAAGQALQVTYVSGVKVLSRPGRATRPMSCTTSRG
jgi:hypothetical protein